MTFIQSLLFTFLFCQSSVLASFSGCLPGFCKHKKRGPTVPKRRKTQRTTEQLSNAFFDPIETSTFKPFPIESKVPRMRSGTFIDEFAEFRTFTTIDDLLVTVTDLRNVIASLELSAFTRINGKIKNAIDLLSDASNLAKGYAEANEALESYFADITVEKFDEIVSNAPFIDEPNRSLIIDLLTKIGKIVASFPNEKYLFQSHSTDLNQYLQNRIRLESMRHKHNSFEIEWKVSKFADSQSVTMEPYLLDRIVDNLLDNALENTDSNVEMISAKIEMSHHSNPNTDKIGLRIAVSDNGKPLSDTETILRESRRNSVGNSAANKDNFRLSAVILSVSDVSGSVRFQSPSETDYKRTTVVTLPSVYPFTNEEAQSESDETVESDNDDYYGKVRCIRSESDLSNGRIPRLVIVTENTQLMESSVQLITQNTVEMNGRLDIYQFNDSLTALLSFGKRDWVDAMITDDIRYAQMFRHMQPNPYVDISFVFYGNSPTNKVDRSAIITYRWIRSELTEAAASSILSTIALLNKAPPPHIKFNIEHRPQARFVQRDQARFE